MMNQSLMKVFLAVGLMIGVATAAAADFPASPVRRCAADAVVAGTVCLDKYEASVWRVPNKGRRARASGHPALPGARLSGRTGAREHWIVRLRGR